MSPPPAEQFAARVFLGPTLRAQPDRRLVDLVRDGYDAAFEEIVRRYRRPLDRFAAAIVGGRSEDVTQDAFSKALLALRGSEAEIELRPWLYRIVRNTALNDLRDRGPIAEELAETLPGGLSAAAVVEAREELRDLMERLGALPEPQRAALVMRELEGLSHEEIAAALGVSGGAARQAIFRARSALREGFGLLLPLPIVRALAAHGDDAARAGGALAGAGASSAGGAALGGIGAGALKAGIAAVLIAGTVGAGVAIDHHRGDRPGPEAAEAATLPRSGGDGAGSAAGGAGPGARRHESESRHGGEGSSDDSGGEGRNGHGGNSGIGDGSRSGSNDVSGHSGSGSGGSGDGDRHGGSSPNSGPGSISGGHHGSEDSGGDSHGGSSGSGSGSDDGGFDDHGGTSGGSGDGSSLESGGGDSSGSGSGEVEPAPEPSPEPAIENGGGSGSGSGSGSDGGSGSGSDGLSGAETSSLDG